MYTRLGRRQPKSAGPTHGQQRTPEQLVRFVEGARDVILKARTTLPRYPSQWHLPVYHKAGRHYDMLGMIASYPVLRHATECIRLRGEVAGQDRKSYYGEIQAPGINDYLREIGHALKEGRYEFSPLRRVEIPKDESSTRTIDIPTIKDRVVESAAASILYDWCSPIWTASSMGFRKGISHQDVMIALERMAIDNERYCWLSTDIADAFGSIPHKALLEIVAKEVPHDGIQKLIERWLRPDSWKNQHGQRGKGIPQGSPLSPFMLNLFLNHALDQKLVKAGTPFIRYADDLLFPCHSKDEANQALQQVKALLKPWGLKLNERKTIIEDARETQIPYIGFLTSIKDGQLQLDIDAQKHINKINMELWMRTEINSDCREYAVKLEDQTSQAKMVIEGWLQHFAPGITNGVLDQVIKGIKGMLIAMRISGVQSAWIRDVWKRSRTRWDEKKQRTLDTSGISGISGIEGSPRTPQASSRKDGVQARETGDRPQDRENHRHDDLAIDMAPFSPTTKGSDRVEGESHQVQRQGKNIPGADPCVRGSSPVSVPGSSSPIHSEERNLSKCDAARGMNKDVVQHAALWLFDGSELLPAPVAVLDSSAPRRPGPMDQDWALTIV